MKTREIKFRVWGKKENKMLDSIGMIGLGYDSFAAGFNRKWLHNSIDWNDEDNFIEDPILMQYTGLKDKNGVEIYEGDVVNVVIMPDIFDELTLVKDENMEVVFEKTYFGVKYDDNSVGYFGNRHTYEVIGNIYENKDLLND